jgi:hypothetical protein
MEGSIFLSRLTNEAVASLLSLKARADSTRLC